MSSSYKPTPEQQEQEPKEKWSRLRSYASLHGETPLASQSSPPSAMPSSPPSPPLRPSSPPPQVPRTPAVPVTKTGGLLKGQEGRPFEPPLKGSGFAQRPTPGVRGQQQPEVEGNNLILYRSSNFYLRTAYRVGQKLAPLHRPSAYAKTMLDQQQMQRMEASETRALPNITLSNPEKKEKIPVPAWAEAMVVVAGLLVVLVMHALNMFNYPRYELDEGTYISSAWAILHGLITPYAYGYGHPPLAWIQIAAWIQLTGGFFTFGNAMNSGRVLMLLYAVASALFVYLIVRRMGTSRSIALLAMALFALSPLALDYQRQILLDNIATFWLLVSLYLLAVGNSRLTYIAGASVAFGISILSKEVMVLFIPGMIYAAWLHTTKFQRKFALVSFIYAFIAVGSMFILMAILRGELFPTGVLPWDHHQHLSLLDTYLSQVKRTQSEGSFATAWDSWISQDKWFVLAGIAGLGFNLIMGWWNRKQLLFALLAISFWVLIVRGGVVLPFYYIPIIPLAAINIALAVNTITGWIGKLLHFDFIRALLVLALVLAIVPYYFHIGGYTYTFTQHPTSAQDNAMTWIRANVPNSDFIVINSYLYMDLRTDDGAGVGDGAPYPYAHVYFNVATDPTISGDLLENNYDRIDYIVADSEMLNDINSDPVTYKIILQALHASVLRAEFKTDDQSSQIDIKIYQVVHKDPQPVVYGGNMANGIAQGTMPVERRNYIG